MKKRKLQLNLYLSSSDIEDLNERYIALYKKVKNATDLSTEQINRMCEVLLQKYNFEIEELSRLREAEYLTCQAQIEAKNKEQIPWRRSWLWRLIFKPTTNRAQDIIEEEAALEADALFTALEKGLENRAKKLYAEDAGAADDVQEAAEQVQPDALPSEAPALVDPPSEIEEPPAPPLRQTRSTK